MLHADIIKINLTVGDKGRECLLRPRAVFLNCTESTPLVGVCKERLATFLNGKRSGIEVTAVEDIGSHSEGFRRVRIGTELHQFRTAGKGTAANGVNACWQVDLSDSSTVLKDACTHGSNIFGNRQCCESFTPAECLVANGSHVIGQLQGGKGTAATESTCANSRDGLRQSNGSERRTAVESIVGNCLQTSEVAQLLQRLDRLSFEHGAKILDSSSLTIAQAAVAVGVPVLHTQRANTTVAEVDGHVGKVIRLHADDRLYTRVVAVARAADALLAWRQIGEQIIAVAGSTPSPVDVVMVVAVVAIADEGMTTLGVGTAQIEGTGVGQFVVAELIPTLIGIVSLLDVLHRSTVAEIGFQRISHTIGIGTRRRIRVVHLHRHATVEHEVCHSLALCGTFAAAVAVAHVCPVDGRSIWNAIYMQLSIDFMLCGRHIGRNGSQRAIGGLVALVIHNLCHSRCHATRHRASQSEIVRAVLIVGVALVPCTRHELWYLRVLLDCFGNGLRMFPEENDLVLIFRQ